MSRNTLRVILAVTGASCSRTGDERVGCVYSIGMVLGGDAVLVDEAAEPVVPADRAGGRRRDRLCWLAGLGRSGAERAVRPMPVVVVDELVQDMP